MTHAWTDRISDYIDGLLDDVERREMEVHLESCAGCRTVEAELRRVVAAAHAARSTPSLPSHDLWPAIAAAIAADAPASNAGAAPGRPAGRNAYRTSAARPRHRFSFSMPQLAAAAMLLVTVSASAAWFVYDARRPEVGTIVQSAGGPIDAPAVRTVATDPGPQYTDDIAELESALERYRDELDPVTIEVIERSLEVIDGAIADARAALVADPGNPHLHRQLDNTLRKKVDVLRRATRVQRGEL